MRPLNPRSARDRRITAFTRSFVISIFPNGDVWQGTFSYDCWGNKQGGLFRQRVEAETSRKEIGTKNYLTLGLTQRGCCPPQLMRGFIQKEGDPPEEFDAAEEAMKLHKRGYFGGGG